MAQIVSVNQALEHLHQGDTVLVGGFLAVGTPEKLVDALVAKGTGGLTLVCNDTSFPDKGMGKLIVSKQAKKVIISYMGANPEGARQMNAGELEVELSPQGTLAERIRAGGAGLGGVLTPTGLGTVVAEGKQVLSIDGKEFLLEKALHADVALLKAYKADRAGNLVFRRAARNFNPIMATAADLVIVEAEHIVEPGEIDPDQVMTPGIFVDYLVQG